MPRTKKVPAVPAEPKALEQVRGSMIQIRVGQRTYDLVRDPSCPVCMHPGRAEIEERILFNDRYPAIAEWVSGVDHERIDGIVVAWPEVTAKQLASHFRRGHCPPTAEMLHQISEERDGSLREGYENTAGRVVDHVVALKQVVARGTERLVRGEIDPGVKELTTAAKALAAIEVASASTEQQDRSWFYEKAFGVYFKLARDTMTDEQWSRFSQLINQNEILRELTAQAQGRAPDAEIIDAELVDQHA